MVSKIENFIQIGSAAPRRFFTPAAGVYRLDNKRKK
jgi:hypothetical protein